MSDIECRYNTRTQKNCNGYLENKTDTQSQSITQEITSQIQMEIDTLKLPNDHMYFPPRLTASFNGVNRHNDSLCDAKISVNPHRCSVLVERNLK